MARKIEREGERETERDRERHRERDRQIDRQKYRQTDRQVDRLTGRSKKVVFISLSKSIIYSWQRPFVSALNIDLLLYQWLNLIFRNRRRSLINTQLLVELKYLTNVRSYARWFIKKQN